MKRGLLLSLSWQGVSFFFFLFCNLCAYEIRKEKERMTSPLVIVLCPSSFLVEGVESWEEERNGRVSLSLYLSLPFFLTLCSFKWMLLIWYFFAIYNYGVCKGDVFVVLFFLVIQSEKALDLCLKCLFEWSLVLGGGSLLSSFSSLSFHSHGKAKLEAGDNMHLIISGVEWKKGSTFHLHRLFNVLYIPVYFLSFSLTSS